MVPMVVKKMELGIEDKDRLFQPGNEGLPWCKRSIELSEGHCRICNVQTRADCQVGETSDKTLVGLEDFVVGDVIASIWGAGW